MVGSAVQCRVGGRVGRGVGRRAAVRVGLPIPPPISPPGTWPARSPIGPRPSPGWPRSQSVPVCVVAVSAEPSSPTAYPAPKPAPPIARPATTAPAATALRPEGSRRGRRSRQVRRAGAGWGYGAGSAGGVAGAGGSWLSFIWVPSGDVVGVERVRGDRTSAAHRAAVPARGRLARGDGRRGAVDGDRVGVAGGDVGGRVDDGGE